LCPKAEFANIAEENNLMISAQTVDVQDRPAIWNPNAAANWSLLFSSAFGAYIQAKNAEVLGRVKEAELQRRWFYASLAWIAVAPFSPFMPPLCSLLVNAASLVLLLMWYFTCGRSQARYIKETFGDSYPKKSWNKPLAICCACLICFQLVVYALSFIASHIHFTAQLYRTRS
jgi:hypothetical protein